MAMDVEGLTRIVAAQKAGRCYGCGCRGHAIEGIRRFVCDGCGQADYLCSCEHPYQTWEAVE